MTQAFRFRVNGKRFEIDDVTAIMHVISSPFFLSFLFLLIQSHNDRSLYVAFPFSAEWTRRKWNCSVTSDFFISLRLAAFKDPSGMGAYASPPSEQANSKMETTRHSKTNEDENFSITINKTDQKRTFLSAPVVDFETLPGTPVTSCT